MDFDLKARGVCSESHLIDNGARCFMCRRIAKALRESAEAALVSFAKDNCHRCRDGERLELVEVQSGGPNYCHRIPYSGYSICVSDEAWQAAKKVSASGAAYSAGLSEREKLSPEDQDTLKTLLEILDEREYYPAGEGARRFHSSYADLVRRLASFGAEREKLEAVAREVRRIVYKDVNTWRVGVHGDSPVPALGAALSALEAGKEEGRNGG